MNLFYFFSFITITNKWYPDKSSNGIFINMVEFFLNFGQRMDLSITARSLVIHRFLIKTNWSYQNSFQNCAMNFNSYVVYHQASIKCWSACLILDVFQDGSWRDTGWKLNVHKTFIRHQGHLQNVLCKSNLHPVSLCPWGIWGALNQGGRFFRIIRFIFLFFIFYFFLWKWTFTH